MKVADADILIISESSATDDNHWQERWLAKLQTARKVTEPDGSAPPSAMTIAAAVAASGKSVVLIAHGFAIPPVIEAAPALSPKVAGAFLVSPPAPGNARIGEAPVGYPAGRLPFPSMVIASRNDPHSAHEAAHALADDWHGLFLDAGESGRVDSTSGHGPWPEGSLVFARFMAGIGD